MRAVGPENPSTTPGKETKEMTSGCCVCAEENGWAGNPLVYCDGPGCEVAVHQGCYGIVEVPEGEWFCARCQAISHNSSEKANIRCELCPSRHGALKRTANDAWTHITCALYIPEVQFGNVDTMDPIIISNVPSERFNKPCYLCEEFGSPEKAKIGACMPCNRTGCRRVFHVTCGQQHGLLCELGSSPATVNVKYCGYCTLHIKKASQDPAIKIIGSSNQDPVIQKDSEQVEIKPVAVIIDAKDDIETGLVKPAVKRPRVNNDSPASDIKLKKSRHSNKLSNGGRSVKTLLKLVGPVVSDTVIDFQRERVAAQHAAAHSQQILAEAQSVASSSVTVSTASICTPVGEPSTSGPTGSNGYGHITSDIERASLAVNGSSLPDFKSHLHGDPSLATISKIAKSEIDRAHLMHQAPSTSGSQQGQFPSTMEELLERQWAQGAQFIKGQAQSDVAQLMTCLNNLKMENMRLQDQMDELQKRRDHLLALNSKLTQSLSCAMTSTSAASPRNSPRTTAAATSAPTTSFTSAISTPAVSALSTASIASSSTPTLCTPSTGASAAIVSLPNSEDSLNKLRSLVKNDVSPQCRPIVTTTSLNNSKLLPLSSANPPSASGRTSVMSSPPAPALPSVNGLTPTNVPLKPTIESSSPVNGQQSSQSFQSLLNSSAGFLVPRLPSASTTVPTATSLSTGSSFPGTQDALLNQLMLQQQQQVLYHVLQQQQSLDPARIARLFSSPTPVAASTDYELRSPPSLVPQMDAPTLRTPEFQELDSLFEDAPPLFDFGFTSDPTHAFNLSEPSSFECDQQQLYFYENSPPCASLSLCSVTAAPCSDDSAPVDLSLLDDFDESILEGLEFDADSWVDFLEGKNGSADLDRLLEADSEETIPSETADLSPCSSGVDVSILNEFFDGFGAGQVALPQQPTVISPDFNTAFNTYCKRPMHIAAEPSTASTTHHTALLEVTKPVPSSSPSDGQCESPSHYRQMRDKNNVASQKSRLKRKLKFEALKEEETVLEKRNAELRQLSDELERQLETYKSMMMRMITK
ncbi:hypothetical protein QR680_013084 [Steinernema hermaphroditum]|uniref:PHD-type domain-containing protein n=1 Tax=Steinernema hermaphroditum TaxID=289476 RepID=A0AA39I6N8_9BILA|nr:hypothetical protein QR680_013084 [Steinernema hermaphroditum]